MVTAALVTAAGTGGGTGVRGLERRCFGFDLADRILLNTILGVMGVFGNRWALRHRLDGVGAHALIALCCSC